MPKLCHCGNPVFSGKTCIWHTPKKPIKKKFVSKHKIKRTPIRKTSKKQAERIREYSKKKRECFYDTWIDGGGFVQCEGRLDGCLNNATDPHHVTDRIGEKLTDFEDIKPLCRVCHDFVKTHPIEAEAMGLIKSRIKKH